MEEKGYNGWKNYETWAVALWIDNEEPLYRERLERVQEAFDSAEPSQYIESDDYYHQRAVANMLKDWIEEMAPDLGASLWADLLNAAIGEVDWRELAEHWIEECDALEEVANVEAE